jgi:hypothetical protein
MGAFQPVQHVDGIRPKVVVPETALALARHPVEDLEAGWDNRPRRAALGKDGEGRMEGRGIVQRAGVERIGIRLAELAAEHETHAARASRRRRSPLSSGTRALRR